MDKKILLIDDEGLVTKSLQKLLKKEGYETVVAASGQEAVQKYKSLNFDLIVCDIRMPQMDGIETIKKIRQLCQEMKRNPTPEILITGYADETSYKDALNLKVADYIYKPFDTKDFLDTIRRNLNVIQG
jgi:CheY-like chemotaxis protein